MKVSNVNGVNQVKSNPVGKAAKAAGIAGGVSLLSKVGSDVFTNKMLIKNPELFTELSESISILKDKELTGVVKDVVNEVKMPKCIKNWYLKNLDPSSKCMQKTFKQFEEMVNNFNAGKIDYAPIVKRAAKGAGITAAVVGVACAVGLGISKAIQNKKAANAQVE